jgi:flagellar hook assembly protein FlgD
MLIASLDDPNTQSADGFKEGNNFELRLWDNQAGLERKAQQVELDKGYNKSFEKLGTSVLAVDFETVAKTSLGDAYPNPSTDKTTFTFQLERESKVRLEIYNAEGDLIKILVEGSMAGGTHILEWDNLTSNGIHASTGVYFYRLKLNNFMETKQLVIH